MLFKANASTRRGRWMDEAFGEQTVECETVECERCVRRLRWMDEAFGDKQWSVRGVCVSDGSVLCSLRGCVHYLHLRVDVE